MPKPYSPRRIETLESCLRQTIEAMLSLIAAVKDISARVPQETSE